MTTGEAGERGSGTPGAAPPAHTAILMGTCNGTDFLPEQLASIAAQTHRDWRLIASDDGSSDATPAILERFRAAQGPARVEIRRGPGAGFVANYIALAGDPSIRAAFYAFADQDDVWRPERLARGIARLAAVPAGRPALYGSRTVLIDREGRAIGCSPCFRAAPGFGNALVQSIAGGNTMLFNAAAKRLFEALADVTVVAHDWWAYQLVSGAGGTVIYDPEPGVAYRQHRGNLIGTNRGLRARTERLRMLASGQFSGYADLQLAALERAGPVLTAEARTRVAAFRRIRRMSAFRRITAVRELGLYRQTRRETLALWIALGFGLL